MKFPCPFSLKCIGMRLTSIVHAYAQTFTGDLDASQKTLCSCFSIVNSITIIKISSSPTATIFQSLSPLIKSLIETKPLTSLGLMASHYFLYSILVVLDSDTQKGHHRFNPYVCSHIDFQNSKKKENISLLPSFVCPLAVDEIISKSRNFSFLNRNEGDFERQNGDDHVTSRILSRSIQQ